MTSDDREFRWDYELRLNDRCTVDKLQEDLSQIPPTAELTIAEAIEKGFRFCFRDEIQ
jgi:hypothetical protein